jgi:hypothetical protein
MDLSGHDRFRRAGQRSPGLLLLANGWAALASTTIERLDIHLQTGQIVCNVVDLRIEGAVAEAASAQGQWTHVFAVDDVVLVRKIPRGG